MTNYNDGAWHGWNGGECPVHPKSMVEAAGYEGARKSTTAFINYTSGLFPWDNFRGAFRVVKEYREPKDQTFDPTKYFIWFDSSDGMVHVREVTE